VILLDRAIGFLSNKIFSFSSGGLVFLLGIDIINKKERNNVHR